MTNDTIRYHILSWSWDTISLGEWEQYEVRLNSVLKVQPLLDIRNCSVSREEQICAFTGINRLTNDHELWTAALERQEGELLVKVDYILTNAISPSGKYICYTAAPLDEGRASLYLVDRASGVSQLLAEKEVYRDCIPSWTPSSDRIVYHTKGNAVHEWDLGSRDARFLFEGSYPMVSPDGSLIAFKRGGSLFMRERETGKTKTLQIGSRFGGSRSREMMSWSPDGRFILVGYSAGIFGYSLSFSVLEVASTRRVRIWRIPGGQRGLQFI